MPATLLIIAVLFAVLAPRIAVDAQAPTPAAIGERVRIATRARHEDSSYVGRVVSAHGDSLTVQADGADGTEAISFRDITTLDVSIGTRTQKREGMLIGSLFGGATGGMIGALSYQKPASGETAGYFGRASSTLAGMIVGGTLGLGIGGFLGSTATTDKWIRRPLGATALRVSPAPGGAVLTLIF